MTNDQEPRLRELSSAEIEVLRQEMRRSIKWAQAELARRCVVAGHRIAQPSGAKASVTHSCANPRVYRQAGCGTNFLASRP